jgi:hypothetical protein
MTATSLVERALTGKLNDRALWKEIGAAFKRAGSPIDDEVTAEAILAGSILTRRFLDEVKAGRISDRKMLARMMPREMAVILARDGRVEPLSSVLTRCGDKEACRLIAESARRNLS